MCECYIYSWESPPSSTRLHGVKPEDKQGSHTTLQKNRWLVRSLLVAKWSQVQHSMLFQAQVEV